MIQESNYDEESLNRLYKEVDAIAQAGVSNPRVWRKVATLAINYNPRIRKDVIACIAEAKEAKSIAMDDYGTSQTKSMRGAMKFPLSLLMLLEIIDPDITRTNKDVEKLYRAFPEFRASAKM